MKSIGLIMPGAGPRGTFYIGAFRAIEEAGIKIDGIVGTSAGSLLSVLYASGVDVMEAYSELMKVKISAQIRPKVMKRTLYGILGDKTFADLDIPLYIQATNLDTLQSEVISEGSLVDAVIASAAWNIFQPVRINGNRYVDGALSSGLGTQILRKEGIGPVVCLYGGIPKFSLNRLVKPFNPIRRAFGAGINKMMHQDLEINPPDIFLDNIVSEYDHFEFDKLTEMIDVGYDKVKAIIPQIEEKIEVRVI